MALPHINHPVFEVYLKSLDKTVKFRPFLVKEEKILLIARESSDDASILSAVKQVVNNCLIDPIDLDKLPLFDLQMLFVHLRMKSVGESVELEFECTINDCNTKNKYTLMLNKVEYEVESGHTCTIELTKNIGVKLKYPTVTSRLLPTEDMLKDSYELIANHIESIYDEEQVHTEFSKEDLHEFLDSLSSEQMNSMLNFFTTSPKVVIKDKVNCKKCDATHEIYSEDIYSFFI